MAVSNFLYFGVEKAMHVSGEGASQSPGLEEADSVAPAEILAPPGTPFFAVNLEMLSIKG